MLRKVREKGCVSQKNACIELNARSRKSFPTLKPRLSKHGDCQHLRGVASQHMMPDKSDVLYGTLGLRRRVGRVGVSVSCVQTAPSRALCDTSD
jgi:hypothetical protein